MIYTTKIDTGVLFGQGKMVEFQKSTVSEIIPEGYMTGDEFEKNVKKGLRQKLKEHGYLE